MYKQFIELSLYVYGEKGMKRYDFLDNEICQFKMDKITSCVECLDNWVRKTYRCESFSIKLLKKGEIIGECDLEEFLKTLPLVGTIVFVYDDGTEEHYSFPRELDIQYDIQDDYVSLKLGNV